MLAQVARVRVQVADDKAGLIHTMSLFNRRKNQKTTKPKPGLYHYTRRGDGDGQLNRIHLKINQDTNGLLIINANQSIHLNSTAVLMAYMYLEGSNPDQIRKSIKKIFRTGADHIDQDICDFTKQLDMLCDPGDVCPIHDLDLDIIPPFKTIPESPYRMDLAITYRCNNNCLHCYNARPRNYPELPTNDWFRIIDQLWLLGIPHAVFTGGEPTLHGDLHKMIAYAEKTGIITGLNTNGRKLSNPDYLDRLISSGLDHIQITLESHDNAVHDQIVGSSGAWDETVAGIRNSLDRNVYIMTNTTLLTSNYTTIAETLDYLADLGVKTIGLNALIYSGRGENCGLGLDETQLVDLLILAREKTQKNGQRLIWYTPTSYCHFDPMQLSLGVKGCTAALYNMCVEPDGEVLPCQSYYHSLGNILTQPWNQIWNNDLAISIRERKYLPEECCKCVLKDECGGGCPLAIKDKQGLITPANIINRALE